MPKEDIQTQGTKHIAFATDDIVRLFGSFKEKGVDIVSSDQLKVRQKMLFLALFETLRVY